MRSCWLKLGSCLTIVLLIVGILGYLLFKKWDQPSSLALAAAHQSLRNHGIEPSSVAHLAVVDFDKPSFCKRLTIYTNAGTEQSYLVAHGSKSGGVYARSFSNQSGSHQTSLGLYRVGESYTGKHGLSYRLHGLDPGVNDLALPRDIVFHSADYVSYSSIWENLVRGEGPRLGRSLGCPAVAREVYDEVLSQVYQGSYWYHYLSP